MYGNLIREALARRGFIGKYDPRHIEGMMRSTYGALDGISPDRIAQEVEFWRAAIDEAGTELPEAVARSYGL